jgi:hypothetical protein
MSFPPEACLSYIEKLVKIRKNQILVQFFVFWCVANLEVVSVQRTPKNAKLSLIHLKSNGHFLAVWFKVFIFALYVDESYNK